MDALDAVLVGLLALSAVRGARLGAAVQLFTLAGVLAGLSAGAALLRIVSPALSGTLSQTAAVLALLALPAAVLGGAGRRLGGRAWLLARRLRADAADAFAGAVLSAGGTLVVCWLLAPVLAAGGLPALAHQIGGSAVLRRVDAVLPPVPAAFAGVDRYLSGTGFSTVLADALPPAWRPVHVATAAQRAQAIDRAAAATVKVVAIGCGEEQEGSGFAVSPGLFVTNAHVVAGTTDITVEAPDGRSAAATAVEYDPRFDLAVLETAPLGTPLLRLDAGELAEGAPAVVLGYPEGGPLRAGAAGISDRLEAAGPDIYGTAAVERVVYQLEATVRPGNSGGPLVEASGEVVGVVFSRSASDPDVGYALASPGVLARVRSAEAHLRPVSTLGCAR